MKKVFNSNIVKLFIPLLLALLLTACEQNPEPLEDTDYLFLHNQCTEYFFNLTENYPLNSKGSCGYVAACSLLEYYDIYYDDTIVDSKYELRDPLDTTSPGLRKMDYAQVKDLDNYQYYKYLRENQDNYLQAFLIYQINELYAEPVDEETTKYYFYHFNSDYPCTVGEDHWTSNFRDADCEIEIFMNNYLHKFMSFDKEYIHVDRLTAGNSSKSARSLVIEKVKQGIPVSVSIKQKKSGHRCIAYDYDEEEDELYVNTLTMENFRHVKLSLLGSTVRNPLVVVINNGN